MPVFGSHLSFRRCCRKQMLVVRYDETILAIIFRTFPWSIACSIPNIGELWLWRPLLWNKKVPSPRWFLTKKLGSPLWSSWAGTLFLPRQNPVQGARTFRNEKTHSLDGNGKFGLHPCRKNLCFSFPPLQLRWKLWLLRHHPQRWRQMPLYFCLLLSSTLCKIFTKVITNVP